MDHSVRALLIATYELGHQPFGLASPAAWLRRDGVDVRAIDLSRDRLDWSLVRSADLVGFHLPMHTAARLALPVIARARAEAPGARLVAYGLYAPPNAALLRDLGIDDVLGPEFEPDLAALARGRRDPAPAGITPGPRVPFIRPDRSGLPPLARYAALTLPGGKRRTVAYTEASRGCKHACRHCPIVPVYGGRFRAVPIDVVLADIGAQVEAGAAHVTFGDPDFLNGPTHALRIVAALHERWPHVSYDVVIKVAHLVRHASVLSVLRDTGCLFITSAFESFDDRVLARLAKGHTAADAARATSLVRAAALCLVPTFVAFTPWTTRASYADMLDWIDRLDLVAHTSPVQLAIRLLLPEGSPLLADAEIAARLTGFDRAQLAYAWTHVDPAVDALQGDVMAAVRRRPALGRRELFDHARALACRAAGRTMPERTRPARARATVPYLDEPWYC